MRPHPLRAGLAGLVDYAGLFPPASLDLPSVLGRFGRYATGPEQWLLGRLIVPAPQLGGLTSFVGTFAAPARPAWTVSLLVPSDMRLDAVGPLAAQFNDASDVHGVAVVAVEHAASTRQDIDRFAAAVPTWLERYVEVPLDDRLPELLDAVMRSGCYAKVRAGGVTADRIPPAAALARFLCETIARDVPFKATAGLHHPLPNRYPLTYAPDGPTGRMHGFVNLVVAAAMARRNPEIDRSVLTAVLEEGEPAAFAVTADAIAWRDIRLTADDLVMGRAHAVRSVGSCSFEEPVEDLRKLEWLDGDHTGP